MNPPSRRKILMISSIAIGAAYGIFVRFVFSFSLKGGTTEDVFKVMSLAFIFVVPLVLGFLTVYIRSLEEQGVSWVGALFLPMIPASISLGCALLFAWEGLICVILLLPIFLILSMLGGIFAKLIKRTASANTNKMVLASFLILPFLVAPLEAQFAAPEELRMIETHIEIHSSPQKIWENIKEVPAIQPQEHFFYFSHLIGFPRPVEAKLIGEGVGAVRHATFEKGVLFIETITDWRPQKYLSFSIKADTQSIPATTLDAHVKVGGPYFDVLRGTYSIETLSPEKSILHLSSTHRLSTRFNFYSHLWTDFIMKDIQGYILQIIKKRCENTSTPTTALNEPNRFHEDL